MELAFGEIRIESYGFFTASDVAPLADDLSQRHMYVTTSVSRTTPPAAEWTEIALALSAVGVPGAIYAQAFIKAWAEEDAKALRAKVLGLVKKVLPTHRERQIMPLSMEIGAARFYFHEPLSDEQFLHRLRAAQEYVSTLPDEVFEGPPGPGSYGHAWYKDSQSWKGQIYGFTPDDEHVDIFEDMLKEKNEFKE